MNIPHSEPCPENVPPRVTLWQLLLVVVAGLAVYANTLQVPFTFDDGSSIVNKALIRDLGNYLGSGAGYADNPRRFVGYLSFALNYRFGGLSVTGYHLVNLAIHLANALTVYLLARVTLKTPFFGGRGGAPAPLRWLPLCAALLFVLHPVQTQAVTYTVQRLTALMSLFYLLVLYLYARLRLSQERGERGRALLFYALAIGCALVAMHTKENSFTLPLAAILYEFCFFRGKAGKRLLGLVPLAATLLVVPLSLLNVQKPLGEVMTDVSQVTQVQTQLSRFDYLCTQFRVIVTYLRLLVFPAGQNLDYDYPLYHSLFAWPVAGSLLLLLSLVVAAIWCWRRSRDGAVELRLVAFGIAFFFLALSVESSVIPIVDVIFEHRLYLPSVGAFLAGSALFSLALGRLDQRGRRGALIAAAVLFVLLGGTTFARNAVWQSEESLWQDVVAKSPAKGRGYINLGAALSRHGREAEAIAPLSKAIEIAPDSVEAYTNLGAALTSLGRQEEAAAALKKALALDPYHPEAYYNLGNLCLQRPGPPGEAISLYNRAIELKPGYDDAYVNLGAAFIKGGDPARAVATLELTSPAGHNRLDRHFNLGVAYVLLGDLARAQQEAALIGAADPAMAQRLVQYMGSRGGR